MLKARGELIGSANPVFSALAVYDGKQKMFLINLGLFFKLPDSGALIDLSAHAEAYFNLGEPGDWHLYMGKKTPETERIRAEVLKFLSASAYYMLDPDALQFGAKAGFDSRPKWKFGPLRVEVAAWVGYDLGISWRPVHAWGSGEMGGHASLKVFGFGLSLTISAALTIETPTPYLVLGEFKCKIGCPWPIPDVKATVTLRWESLQDKEPLPQLVTAISLEASKNTGGIDAQVYRGSTITAGDTFSRPLCSPGDSVVKRPDSGPPPDCTAIPMVPVTFRPVVAFGRNTNEFLTGSDNAQLVGNTGLYIDEVGEGDAFAYKLTGLRLWAMPKTTSASLTIPSDPLPNVYGAWPALIGDPMQPGALYVKLWSKNPFDIYEANTYLFYDDGTGSWPEWFAEAYGDYPCQAAGLQLGRFKRCADPAIMEQADLILPPYHVFAIAVESEVTGVGAAKSKSYRDLAYFHTEGVPLDLNPFVYNTVPGGLEERHYRNYDVGLRFNESYMDLLYKEPGSIAELRYKDPLQKLVIEIVDETNVPLRDPDGNLVPITTRWEQAPNHVATRTDEAWLKLMQDRGIAVNTDVIPTDDMVYGRPDWAGGFGPAERYTVRVWFTDKRLLHDERISDTLWREVNAIDEPSGDRVLLYEFPLITSRFDSFQALGETYEGKWWPLEVNDFDTGFVGPIATQARARTKPPSASINNSNSDYIGRFLFQAARVLSPEELAPGVLESYLVRVSGYNDKPLQLTDENRRAIIAVWKDELLAFGELDDHFMLNRAREPLPQQVELNLLAVPSTGGTPGPDASATYRGFLIELPEPIEWARVQVDLFRRPEGDSSWSMRRNALIINPAGTRAFLFDITTGSIATLIDGEHKILFSFNREIADRNPLLKSPTPAAGEFAEFIATVPDGKFVPETS